MNQTRKLDASNMQSALFEKSNVSSNGRLLDEPYNMPDATKPEPAVYAALTRIKPQAITLGGWATKAGMPRNIFNGIRDHGNPTRKTLEKLLAAIDWTVDRFETESGLYKVQTEVRGVGGMDADEMRSLSLGDRALAPLPLYGSAIGGDLGTESDFQLTELDLSEVLDHLLRPASLADDETSYALTIVGESMSPRFKPSERVGVSPRSRVEIGDDVIVQLRGEQTNRVHRVLIKELVRRSASQIILRQHNPPRELSIPTTSIIAMHKVKGHFL